MIRYYNGLFGLVMMFRLHGSAAFRALIPSSISMAILFALYYGDDLTLDPRNDKWLSHPYAVGALMAAYTFLLTFKTTFSYNRYWEACTAVHQMHSKWLDVGVALAAFHLQSTKFDHVRPAAFGQYPHLTSTVRERERTDETTLESLQKLLEETDPATSLRSRFQQRYQKSNNVRKNESLQDQNYINNKSTLMNHMTPSSKKTYNSTAQEPRLDGGMNKNEPSLFIQELTHLLSLMSAVSLSTLRNDIEGVESPLIEFIPGSPWPPVDPDEQDAEIRKEFYSSSPRFIQIMRFLLGRSRDEKRRTLYNAARPFRVVGGASDAEVQLLQQARGPYAKVALCSMWLQEFVSREHLAGSTGKVAPPIISRMYQFTSDGMIGYNHARKVAYIPFPFPHAQLTAFFVWVVVVYVPFLMLSYAKELAFAAVLNFFTVLCFTGLYEVSRELENPFQNVPNDLPLNNFQAQFNEALLVLYAGYHPDAWWQTKKEEVIPSTPGIKAKKAEVEKVISAPTNISTHSSVVDPIVVEEKILEKMPIEVEEEDFHSEEEKQPVA